MKPNIFDISGAMSKHEDVLGIDIGVSSIKIAWVHKAAAGAEVKASAVKQVTRSETGNFIDSNTDFVAGIIKSYVKEINFPGKKAYLCISGPNIFVRRISLVSMPKDELQQAVKWAVRDQVSADLEKTIIDYQVLGEAKDSKGTVLINILAAIAGKRFVFECVDVIAKAGLNLSGISLFAFSLSDISKKNPIMAVLDIGAFKSEFILFNDSLPQFSRVLPGSGNEFTKTMTGALVSDKGKLELTYDEAEKLKIEVGIPDEGAPVVKQEISNAQFISMFRPVVEKLENDLRRSMEYCRAQLKLYVPKKIYVTGGGSLLKNLDKILEKDIGMEIAYFKDKESVIFDAAIAVAVDAARPIDLIPAEVRDARTRKLQRAYLRMVSVISFSVLFLAYLFMSMQVNGIQRQIKIANANYNAIQEVTVLKDKIDKRRFLLQQLGIGQHKVSSLLKALSKSTPAVIELDLFAKNSDSSISIKGTVAGIRPEVTLADFTKVMQETKVFDNIKIISLQKNTSQTAMSNFTIYCEVADK